MSDYGVTLLRKGECTVTLRHVDTADHLTGTWFYEHVELPALVDVPSVGRTWYVEVWERHGWKVVG